MKNQNNSPAGGRRAMERRMLPFAVEFVKFFIVFAIMIAVALFALHYAAANMG